jgi:NAD(P)-dependent dehydrogenase (short-subunit alcohol dehydrogenase family)
MSLLEGKIALVTGAGRGVGRAVALALAAHGARVVVNDVGCELDGSGFDEAPAAAVVEEIAAAGGKAVENHDDVATGEGAKGAVQTAIDAYGDLDVLVCSAGIARDKTLLKMDEASWDRVVGVGLKGTFLTMQAAARQMVSLGHGGRMVVMTGLSGYLGNFAQANLAAACGGIHGLMRTASIEWQKHKITVNAVAPLAKTRMTEALPLLQGFDNLTPEHVAPAVVALASDLCGDRTGYVVAATGARMYAFRFVESAGKFKDESSGIFTPEEIDENFHAITKV